MSAPAISSSQPARSQSGAPVSFKGARASPNAADRSKRRESDHSFTSRGPVIELDDDDQKEDPSDSIRDAPPELEDTPTSQSYPSIPPLHEPVQSGPYGTARPSGSGRRQGSVPVPAAEPSNRQPDLRGPLPAFRILGHPEFSGSVHMPEATPAPSHHLPGGLIHSESGSSRDSRVTEGTDDDERMWEENQALYRAIQSRLGIEGSTPSDKSSSATTPILPIPGGFPDAFRFGGAESSENEGEESAAFDARPPHSFPQPPRAGSSGTSLPPSMPYPTPARAPLLERPSTDTFFSTNSDSVYLTPHHQEGEEGGEEVKEVNVDEDEDYTRTLSGLSMPEAPPIPPPFPAPIPQPSLPEPTTPKAASGMPKTRPSIPEPSTLPHGHPRPSIPEPQPKVLIPEPIRQPELPQPHSMPSIPVPPVPTAMPKPEPKPTVFSALPSQHAPRPQHTPPPQLHPPTPLSMPPKPTVTPPTPPPAASHQAPASYHSQPSGSHPSLGPSQGAHQKPPRPHQQHLTHAAAPLAASTNLAKPPSNLDHGNSGSSVGAKPSGSALAAPPKPANALASSHSASSIGSAHGPKPTKPAGSPLAAHSGGNVVHTSSSASLSTAKPPPKPSPSISEFKPPKISPSHSTSPQVKQDHQPVASSSGKQSSHNTRYVNMLLALDDIPNYWNLLASFFTWILLAGFLLFPGTFTSWREEQAQAAGAGGVSDQVKGAVLDVVSHVPL